MKKKKNSSYEYHENIKGKIFKPNKKKTTKSINKYSYVFLLH